MDGVGVAAFVVVVGVDVVVVDVVDVVEDVERTCETVAGHGVGLDAIRGVDAGAVGGLAAAGEIAAVVSARFEGGDARDCKGGGG